MTSILVADTDDSLVCALRDCLGTEAEIHWVKRADEAIESFCQLSPHVFVVNLLLPGEHGFSILRRLGDIRELDSLPILAIADKAYPLDLAAAAQLGANVTLAKSAGRESICSEVKAMLNGALL
ncbi:MAG: response regulator [Planctomycetota bacterium]|nr:response regulator [Planctomycetota bacterium]MDP7252212.1 response regulator [Planctomycetota bacterium]